MDVLVGFWINHILSIGSRKEIVHAKVPTHDHTLMDVSDTFSTTAVLYQLFLCSLELKDDLLKEAILTKLHNFLLWECEEPEQLIAHLKIVYGDRPAEMEDDFTAMRKLLLARVFKHELTIAVTCHEEMRDWMRGDVERLYDWEKGAWYLNTLIIADLHAQKEDRPRAARKIEIDENYDDDDEGEDEDTADEDSHMDDAM